MFMLLMTSIAVYAATPSQVRLSLTSTPQEIMVTWITRTPSDQQQLVYYSETCNVPVTTVPGTQKYFSAGEGNDQYITSAVITLMQSYCHYSYKVGETGDWSDTYVTQLHQPFFKGTKQTSTIIFGDLGSTNNEYTLAMLNQEVGRNDLLLHLGDFAYDLMDNNGAVGDTFFDQIEPIASNVPYMGCPGNHERHNNFTQYINRFNFPVNEYNQGTNFYYSFDLGLVHYIMYNTEPYFWYDTEGYIKQNQLDWLREDLKAANDNRDKVPWIVVSGHNPYYCNIDWALELPEFIDVTQPQDWERLTLKYDYMHMLGNTNYNCQFQGVYMQQHLEQLFYDNSVDLMMSGHVHNYERNTPIFRNQTVKSEYDSFNMHYNYKAPVYIVSGIPGNNHKPHVVSTTPQDWSVYSNNVYGYGKLTTYNSTHMLWEQYNAETQTVLDYVWLVKTYQRY